MLSKTRNTPVASPAPGVIPDRVTGPAGNGSHLASGRHAAAAQPSAATHGETPRERSHRKAHRSRLHGYAIVAVALVAYLIALAASNTAHVNVNWVLGSSRVPLVWLVLIAAILGWLLGLAATAAFHWRTRAPRRQHRARS
jgi:uncharacterized integral membrane protein